MRVFRSRILVACVASTVTALVVGSVAWATIPDSRTGVVVACYPKTGATAGVLRVINYQTGARCRSSEAMVSWPTSGMRYRGAWSTTSSYYKGDVVGYAGSSYIATKTNSNITPTNPSAWALMAAKGVPGQQGIQGPKGDTGPAGPGATPIDWHSTMTGQFVSILQLDGLTISAKCGNFPGQYDSYLQATSSVMHATIRSWGIGISVANMDFNPGMTRTLGSGIFNPFLTIVYTLPSGGNVVVIVTNEKAIPPLYNGAADCAVEGYALASA